MTGQRQNILAAMGVDVWVPRAMPCQKKVLATIWRDQAIDLPPENTMQSLQQQAVARHQPVVAIVEQVEKVQTDAVQPVVMKPALSTPAAAPKPIPPLASVQVQQEAFTLEAYCLEQAVLLIESSKLSKEQRQLWMNIQAALPGMYSELKWPFALENFRDGRGVQAYIQGFLDALALDKRVLILGQLDFVSHSQSMQLASLQDMIDQPLLKRRLWQLMLSP